MVLDLIPNMYGCVLVVGAVTVCLAAGGGGVGKKPALSKVASSPKLRRAHKRAYRCICFIVQVEESMRILRMISVALALPDWLNKVIRFKGL